MKKLKQALSLTLALVLSLALAAPAFAAEYQEMKIAPFYSPDYYITFSAAKLGEPVTKRITDAGDVYMQTFVPLILQPNSQIIVPDEVGEYTNFFACVLSGDNDVERGGLGYLIKSCSAEEFFSECADQKLNHHAGKEVIPIFYAKDDTEYWVMLGDDGSAAPGAPAEPAKPAEPAAVIPEGSVAYTVQKGDTLGFIATNFYGSNAQREALYKANIEAFRATKGALTPGMVLAIPAVQDKAVRIPAPVAGAGEKLYTVKLGDTLGQIAAAEYGNANEYKAIFERNSDRLKDANTIYEGQVIVLPAKK